MSEIRADTEGDAAEAVGQLRVVKDQTLSRTHEGSGAHGPEKVVILERNTLVEADKHVSQLLGGRTDHDCDRDLATEEASLLILREL